METALNGEKDRLRQLFADFLKIIVEIVSKIVRYFKVINVEDLYTELNTKLGFEFEYRVFSAPDFCHFLYYYCGEIIHIEFMSGLFMAYSKRPERNERPERQNWSHRLFENPETSTPNFCNSFSAKTPSYNVMDLVWYHHDEENKEEYVADSNEDELNETVNFVNIVDCILNVLVLRRRMMTTRISRTPPTRRSSKTKTSSTIWTGRSRRSSSRRSPSTSTTRPCPRTSRTKRSPSCPSTTES